MSTPHTPDRPPEARSRILSSYVCATQGCKRDSNPRLPDAETCQRCLPRIYAEVSR